MPPSKISLRSWSARHCTAAFGLSALLALPVLAPAAPPAPNEIQKLVNEGKSAQALKVIDDQLAKTPKDAQLQFQRGVVLSMLNRKPEALDTFKKLVADNPSMAPAYNNMAVIYAAMSDYEGAKGALDKAIRISPDYATAYQNLGDVYVQFATQAYQKSMQLDKSDAGLGTKVAMLRDVLNPGAGDKAGSSTHAAAPATNATPSFSTAPISPLTGGAAAAANKTAVAPAAAVPPSPRTVALNAKPADAPMANASAEVSAAVRNWAAAWSNRDAAAYIDFYAPDYSGTHSKRSTWEKERTERIKNRSRIKVEVSDLVVSAIGDKAEVRFRQSYESDGPKEVSRKVLNLTRNASGQWLITKEATGA